jgi:hypothetical protein
MAGFHQIAERVLTFIRSREGLGPVDPNGVTDAEFSRLALDTFAMQYEANAPYRAFCTRRGATPGRVSDWRAIAAVPASAFKILDFACASPEKVFLTSGTSRGAEERGRHLVPRLELYREAALATFSHAVLGDGLRPRIIALVAPPSLLPSSSLAQMVDWIVHDLAAGEGEYLVDQAGFDAARAAEHIDAAARAGGPLCLIGLRVLFTRLLDHCRSGGRRFSLPADSRIVDTGGPKGGRALSDAGFLSACWQTFGVAGYYCVNEYGMTELCSQFYDNVLAARFAGSNAARRKVGPPWVRTLAVDPATLEPLPDGAPGILRHIDLANAGSVIAVQTDDLGVTHADGFELLGRARGAEPRGCALALADLLESSPVRRAGASQ